MSAAFVCLAMALLAVPASAARRRFARLYLGPNTIRMLQHHTLFRLCVGGGVLAALLYGVGPFLAAAMVAGTVGFRVRRAHRDRRRSRECGYLLDALDAVIGELRVGAHPSAAAEVAAGEARGESAKAFAVSAGRSRLGGSAADGLRQPNSPVAEELSRIADAWQVAERHGLALAELLAASRTDLVGRIRFHGRTTASLAGPRATATVLAGLPLLGIGLGQLMGAAPLHVLFASTTGTVLLPLGAALACTGLLWTDAITRKVLT